MEKWQAHPAHDLAQWTCPAVKLSMTMSRPVFTLSDAARLTRVSRSSMRRYREAGDFPNAYKNTKDQWMIPIEDLIAKGLNVNGDPSTVDALTAPAHDQERAGSRAMPISEVDALREEVHELRTKLAVEHAQREGVENVLAEVRRRADSLDMALRQLEAPKQTEWPTLTQEEEDEWFKRTGIPASARHTQPAPAPKQGWWAKLWASE